MEKFEKGIARSKKFIAFFFSILILAGIAGMFTFTQILGAALTPVLLGIVLTIGFISVGYIFSTATLDKFVRMAMITTGKEDNNEESNNDGDTKS